MCRTSIILIDKIYDYFVVAKLRSMLEERENRERRQSKLRRLCKYMYHSPRFLLFEDLEP